MIRIIINGSRGFSDYNLLKRYMKSFIMMRRFNPDQIEIISGGARGADTHAIKFTEEYNLQLKIMKPDWSMGRRAGILRNQEMLDYATTNIWEKAILVSFWDGQSRGTKHMIDISKKKGIEVNIVNF